MALPMRIILASWIQTVKHKPSPSTNAYEIDRYATQIQYPEIGKYTDRDIENTTSPKVFQIEATENSLNFVGICKDDTCIGESDTFGCLIPKTALASKKGLTIKTTIIKNLKL
jgi:hypothetical protein